MDFVCIVDIILMRYKHIHFPFDLNQTEVGSHRHVDSEWS